MWARSSSAFVRIQGSRLGAWRLESLRLHVQRNYAATEPSRFAPEMGFTSEKSPHNLSMGSLYHSSQAESGAKNVGQEDHELGKGFSELEIVEEDSESGSETEPESELELCTENKGARSLAGSDLVKAILINPNSVRTVLDKYVSDGNPLDASVISHTMVALRKRLMFQQALQLSKWLEEKKAIEFNEASYASRLDLIAKVHGLQKAEQYITIIPKSLRGQLVYRTLLANCVFCSNVQKAENIYNKMRQLNFANSVFTCNQMIILYKKVDKKKIADVLLYMEKENVKPNLVTYKHLIDTKGRSGDISGMENVLATMEADCIKPDLPTKAVMAKYYINSGFNDKAKLVLLEIQNTASKEILIPLYAGIGNEEEVERVWGMCQPNPRHGEYIAAINAWGRLKKVEKAEALFDELAKRKKLASRDYAALLMIYAENKMAMKGEEVVRKMKESGCEIGALSWDALVKLYLELGEVEKADAILEKGRSQESNLVRPMFSSYLRIMEEYAKRGDVHNSEKLFARLKEVGYSCRITPFVTLLQAYRVSGRYPYGFKERMMAENLFPNRSIVSQLAEIHPFKKTEDVLDLFD